MRGDRYGTLKMRDSVSSNRSPRGVLPTRGGSILTSGVLDVDQNLVRSWDRHRDLLEFDGTTVLREDLRPLHLGDLDSHCVRGF